MASIEYLLMKGIRAFSADPKTAEHRSKQQIKFFRPLTIILGQNGAGKTTIIEALRTGCTGEMPPGTGTGSSFIHDPKVAGRTEVKAQIRFQFRSIHGQQVLVVRSFQVTQMKNREEFKRVDVTMQTRNSKGDMVVHSGKCSEIDKAVPALMGVEKAILDHVIFCHQEDCNWPLSDPGKLKKKFDDIFSATRYTKALEEIRKFRLEQSKQVAAYKEELIGLTHYKEEAAKIQTQLEDDQAKHANILLSKKNQLDKSERLKHQLETAQQACNDVSGLRDAITKQEAQIETCQEFAQRLHQAIDQEYEETDAELDRLKSQFHNAMLDLRTKYERMANTINASEREVKELESELVEVRTQCQVLEAQQKSHRANLQSLQAVVRDISNQYRIAMKSCGQVDHGFVTGEGIIHFVKEFESKVQSLIQQSQQLRARHRQEAASDSEKVQKRKLHLATIGLDFQSKKKDKDLQCAELEAIRAKVECLSSTKSILQTAHQELKNLNADLISRRESSGQAAKSEAINGLRNSINDATQKSEGLYKEMQGRDQEQAQAYQLQAQKAERDRKNSLLQGQTNEVRDRLRQKVRKNVDPQFMDVVANERLGDVVNANSGLAKRMQEVNNNLAQWRTTQRHSEQRKSELEKGIALHEQKLSAVAKQYKDHPIPKLIEDNSKKVDSLRDKISQTKSLKMCYETFVRQASERSECPVCCRGLSNKELDKFVKDQRSKCEQAPALIQKTETALSDKKELLQTLNQLLPLELELQKLTKELPAIQDQLDSCKQKVADQEFQARELQTKLDASKKEETDIRSLVMEAEKLKNLQAELQAMNENIDEAERKQSLTKGRPLDVIREEYNTKQGLIAQWNADIEKMRCELDEENKKLAGVEETVREKEREISALERKEDEKSTLEIELKSKLNSIRHLEKALHGLEEAQPKAQRDLRDLEEVVAAKKQKAEREEEELNQIIVQHDRDLNLVQSSVKDVKDWITRKRDQELDQNVDRLRHLQGHIQHKQQSLAATKAEMEEMKRMVDGQEGVLKNLDANRQYRAARNQVAGLKAELEESNRRLKAATGHLYISGEAQTSLDCFALKDHLRNELSNLHVQVSHYEGQETQLRRAIQDKEHELKGAKFGRVAERHASMVIKMQTSDMAVKDLEKYAQALDNALMKYHSSKMEEINALIKELWQKTYRGQDIDYIEIKSDVYDENNPGTASKSRSYRYRVIMVKGDVPLDMRGRCSAGQKVLASLVIRLALSEAFCENCAILALDEPTTNLDQDNIQSLADALLAIINARREQQNFQLIVITHDEDFVRRLGLSGAVEYFYNVHKDSEGHCSLVEKRRFCEL